jgi:hypothetical protein
MNLAKSLSEAFEIEAQVLFASGFNFSLGKPMSEAKVGKKK